MSGTGAAGVAERVGDHPVLHLLGRIGLVTYGMVNVLLAVLAVQVAVGGAGRADKAGALQAVASTAFGRFVLWVAVVGLVALVVWQLVEAAFGHRGLPGAQRTRRRLIALGEAVVFALLAKTAVDIASDGGSKPTSAKLVTFLLELPGGAVLLGLAGAGIVVVGAYAVWRGVSGSFLEELDLRGAGASRRQLVTVLGRVGWPAVGAAYGLCGVLIVVSAVQYDPAQPVGLDASLKAVGAQPFGQLLLLVLAAGLAVFGAYSLFDARYRKD